MIRLLYENSVSSYGHLIIPFVFAIVEGNSIYSYKLLSQCGHKGSLHKAENPEEIYAGSIEGIIEIAKKYLNKNSEFTESVDVFRNRYTYYNNLIIIYELGDKYFYDHYPPDKLNNIAAPTIFKREIDCIKWIKQGLARANTEIVETHSNASPQEPLN